jgi:hypothetical protein
LFGRAKARETKLKVYKYGIFLDNSYAQLDKTSWGHPRRNTADTRNAALYPVDMLAVEQRYGGERREETK